MNMVATITTATKTATMIAMYVVENVDDDDEKLDTTQ